MEDFGTWFANSFKQVEEEKLLPEGVFEHNGKYLAACCVCDEISEILCNISEIPEKGYDHYCGKSPRCCP